MASEKWFERLDRLLAEHAAEVSSSGKSEAATKPSKPGGKSGVADTEMITRCEKALEEFKQKKRKIDSDQLTLRVLQSGTLTDRIAAMALVIGDEPLQSLNELDKLVKMCSSKGRREAALAMDAMRDLLLERLLPPTRRLEATRTSFERIADRTSVSDEILALIKFEDLLKTQVWTFVHALEHASKDELTHHKITSMRRAADLLQERPEQERFLLSLLCSKMGDPDHKAASQASHLLRRVANAHPQMRLAMVSELEASILSTSATQPYVYEATIFLNQTILRRGDAALAERLVGIYFSLFERSMSSLEAFSAKAIEKHERKQLKKKNRALNRKVAQAKQGVSSKLMAALLTGVNRAVPFCNLDDEASKTKFQKRCEQLHRVVKQTESFHNATQALALLFRLETDRDRYYKALASKITDPAVLDGKRTGFLNLVYRSLKADPNRSRVVKNIKLLLGVALKSSAAFAAGALFLLSCLVPVQRALFVDLLGEEPEPQDLRKEMEDAAHTLQLSALGNVVGSEINEAPAKPKKELIEDLPSSVAWELEAFRVHYHPTVQAFARRILDREPIEYDGDPLHDFSITAFLDRFVYRNPKEKKPGDADAVESGPSKVFGSKGREQRLGVRVANDVPVNSEAFHERFARQRTKVGEETERFFFKYFDHLKKQGRVLAQGVQSGRDVDREEQEDEYADKLVEDLLKKGAGGVDADLDEDDFLDEFSPPEDNGDDDDVADVISDDGDAEIPEDDEDGMLLGEDDDDEEVDFDEDEDDEDEDGATGPGKYGLYADADDFAGLLEDAPEEFEDDDDTAAGKSKRKWKGKEGKAKADRPSPNLAASRRSKAPMKKKQRRF